MTCARVEAAAALGAIWLSMDLGLKGKLALVTLSGIRLARRYIPEMLARKWGRVIFISSESATTGSAIRVDGGVLRSIT